MKYFDNAATTYPKPECVYGRMNEINRSLAVNTGRGAYRAAREATEIVDRLRNKLLTLVKGRDCYDVILTPSATIALNEIIGGMEWSADDMVYVSPFEHNAVMRPLYLAQKKYKFQILEMAFDSENGQIDFEKTEFSFLTNPPTKLFMTHMSNVTGYILPIEKIAKSAKEYDCEIVVDASQSLGLLELNLRNSNFDYIAFAGHKNLYGPFGCGGFFIKKGNVLNAFLAGGTGTDSLNLEMPKEGCSRYEPASQNIVALAGLEVALDETIEYENEFYVNEKHLTDRLVSGLKKVRGVKLYIPGTNEKEDTHIGVVAFNVRGYKASEVGLILDEDFDIAVRTGYHCAPLIHRHLKDEDSAGVVRASVGRYTTESDVEALIEAVKELAGE